MTSVPFLHQARQRGNDVSPFSARHPLQLAEGGRAYVLHRFTHADARALALLVAKTDTLLARHL